jgi:hypothetical protein
MYTQRLWSAQMIVVHSASGRSVVAHMPHCVLA